MVKSIFTTRLESNNNVAIPSEVIESLSLTEGDRVEVTLTKIKTKRLGITISRNPLAKLLDIKPS